MWVLTWKLVGMKPSMLEGASGWGKSWWNVERDWDRDTEWKRKWSKKGEKVFNNNKLQHTLCTLTSPSAPRPSKPAGCVVCSLFSYFFVLFDDDMRYAKCTFRVYAQRAFTSAELASTVWLCIITLCLRLFFFFFSVSLYFLLRKKWSFGKSRTSIYDKTRTYNFSIKVIPKYQATCMSEWN